MNKEQKIRLTVEAFLTHPNYTIEELTQFLRNTSFKDIGISKSSVQRYLNDPKVIDLYSEEVLDKIRALLSGNISNGRKKGGINSFKNNVPIKASKGRFIGSQKAEDSYRLETKIADILFFAKTFLLYPSMSLQDMADFYNQGNLDRKVTRDYVYDCLTSNEQYELLDGDVVKKIKEQLKERRYQGNINGATTTNQMRRR